MAVLKHFTLHEEKECNKDLIYRFGINSEPLI